MLESEVADFTWIYGSHIACNVQYKYSNETSSRNNSKPQRRGVITVAINTAIKTCDGVSLEQ